MRTTGIIAGMLMTVAVPLAAQELPEEEDLAPRVKAAVPPYWEMSEFRLVAVQLKGDAIEPLALIRFEADVSPDAPLYTATDDFAGPFALIMPTVGAETDRKLYGTMQLYYKAGEWSGGADLENPVDGLGKPRDMFVDPTLILGSEDQDAILAKMRDNEVADEKQKLAEELAELRGEHGVKMSTLRGRLTRERDALAEEIAELKAGHEKDMAETEARYKARLETLRENYDPKIAAEEKKLNDKLDELRSKHAAEMQSLRQKQAAEITELETEHAKALGRIKARQAEQVAELEAGFEARKARLQRQIEEAESIVSSQNELIAKLEVAAENDAQIQSMITANKTRQKNFFKSFVTPIPGSITCESTDNNSRRAFPFQLQADRVLATGLYGKVVRGDDEFPMNLTLVSKSGARPLEFSFSPDWWSTILNDFVLTLNESGIMKGSASGRMKVGRSVSWDDAICIVTLSTG